MVDTSFARDLASGHGFFLQAVFAGGLCIFAAKGCADPMGNSRCFWTCLTVVPPTAPDQLATIGAGLGFGMDRLVSIRVSVS